MAQAALHVLLSILRLWYCSVVITWVTGSMIYIDHT